MSTDLIPANQVDFTSKFLYVKPATIQINQPMTQAEDAIKGQLRVKETGEQFPAMTVALLVEPQERRDYDEGQYPNRVRLCFSNDMVRPSQYAKEPQALTCAACKESDWTPWREYLERTGKKNPELVPGCDRSYYIVLVDTETKLPLQMYVKGAGNRKAFEKGMENVAREMFKLRSKGLKPQYYDVQFTLTTEKAGANNNYNLKIKDVKAITEESRAAFGEVYLNFVSMKNRMTTEQESAAEEQEVSNVIEAELTNNQGSDIIDAEYTQI